MNDRRNRVRGFNIGLLSPCQVVIMQRLMLGQSRKDIAMKMKTSTKTVDYHTANLKRRLGVDSLAGLVRKGLKLGLACLALAASAQTPANVTLQWAAPVPALSYPSSFIVYGSTNLATPLAQWTALTNIVCPLTPLVSTNQGLLLTNYVVAVPTNCVLSIAPGRWFFTMTTSNYWGVSPFSNLAATPPLPPPVAGLGIR